MKVFVHPGEKFKRGAGISLFLHLGPEDFSPVSYLAHLPSGRSLWESEALLHCRTLLDSGTDAFAEACASVPQQPLTFGDEQRL